MVKLVLIVALLIAFWLWLRAKPKKVGSEAEARAILGGYGARTLGRSGRAE